MMKRYLSAYTSLSHIFNPSVFVDVGTYDGTIFESINNKTLMESWAIDPYKDFENKRYSQAYHEFSMKVHECPNVFPFITDYVRASMSFPDEYIGLLHINGPLFHRHVEKYYKIWEPKVQHTGIIILSGINDPPIHALWSRIKKTNELVSEIKEHKGIGIINKGKNRMPFLWGTAYETIDDFLGSLQEKSA